MIEQPTPPAEPNKTMDGHFFKGLAVNVDQQGSGSGDLPANIAEYYRRFLGAGCDREDALDLSARFWARVVREYRT